MVNQQQTVLRDAMRRLNMTCDAFAARIGVSRCALDTMAPARRVARVTGHAGDCDAFISARFSTACRNRMRLRRAVDTIQFEGAAATAFHRPVFAGFRRGAVPHRRPDATHRAAQKDHPRSGRHGARQSVFRGQHADRRKLRLGVLPAGRLGLRHDQLHFLVDGEGRIHLRHEPRDQWLRGRHRRAASRARLGRRICACDQYSRYQRGRWLGRTSESGAARSLRHPA